MTTHKTKLDNITSDVACDKLNTPDDIGPRHAEPPFCNIDFKNIKNGFDDDLTKEWKRSPSYSNSYEDEWFRLFKSENISFQAIQSLGLTGELRNCRFRSVCWRIYLEVISPNSDHWIDEINKHRKLYIDLRNKYVIDPRCPESASHPKLINDDPLSLKNESKWNKYFKSQDIMKEIKQDVVRTFPEIEFFHSTSVRTSMINVLYCYSQTSQLYYRQGMHEILAPLIFVLHCDHMAFEHSLEMSNLSSSMRKIGGVLLDSSFLEHDAYSIFSKVMSIIESWYDGNSPRTISITNNEAVTSTTKKVNAPELRPFEKPREILPESSAGQRLNHIHDNILKRHDLDLYLHLENLEISPQMFGLRWLKLLFGREYTMQDLLMVWDLLFAVDRTFTLVDHIYVSMLVHIRDYLLASDFASCLTQLMRYPTNVDVNQIIDYALYLFDPDRYPKPIETAQYRGVSSFPMISPAVTSLKKKRAQRNKTIVGIETFANRLSSFINKKPALESPGYTQIRPSQLMYRHKIPSVSDSAPVTPTNINSNNQNGAGPQRLSDIQSCPVDVTDYLDISIQNQNNDDNECLLRIVSMCSKLVNQSINDINFHIAVDKTSVNLDKAVATLKQARDILNGNLTLNRKELITQIQYDRPSHIKRINSSPNSKGLNRSVSNNDITALRNSSGGNSTEIDLSEKLLRFLPSYNADKNNVELQGMSFHKT